jgi:hypothetical protein
LPEKPETTMECVLAILHKRVDLLDINLQKDILSDKSLELNLNFAAFSFICDGLSNCKYQSPEEYAAIAEQIKKIQGDHSFLFQLFTTLNSVLVGMTTFLEYSGQSNNKWRDVWPFFLHFLEKFSDSLDRTKFQS